MRVTIFGATGRTGRHLLEQALAAGHEVTVLVRDPAKVSAQSERLRVLVGDVQDVEQVERAVRGAEAVISVLGPTHNRPTYEVSKGMEHIIAAMERQGVRRLIASAGAGVGDPKDTPGPVHHFFNFLVKRLSRYVYEDMVQTVERVRASDLDWTVVRVPRLRDGPHTGNARVGYVGKGVGVSVSRPDLADFMLRQLENDRYVRQAPVVSN